MCFVLLKVALEKPSGHARATEAVPVPGGRHVVYEKVAAEGAQAAAHRRAAVLVQRMQRFVLRPENVGQSQSYVRGFAFMKE